MSARSLVEAADLLARGQASGTELLDAALSRIQRFDDHLHAWTILDGDGARAAAEASDRRQGAGRRRSPLDGVPIGIKDLIDTQGIRTSYGSPLFERHVPARDAHVVRRLRRAGAVIVGKTVTTQFATFDPPATRNPWNAAHTPGGSSSGSAAAVAARMVPAAIGTQTGGSTIRPAAYCGIAGYIPSPGWVGRSGIFPCAWSLDRVGLFGTCVADLGLVLDGCIGRDRADSISRAVRRRPMEPRLPGRVAVLDQLVANGSPAMRRAVGSVADALATAGAEVTAISLDDLEIAHAAHFTVMRVEVAAAHADLHAENPQAYAPEISALVVTGSRVRAADYLRALRVRGRFRRELRQKLERFDLVLAPAAVGEADASLATIGSPVMNLVPVFGGLPALTLPAGLGDAGLPLGMQLMGQPDGDDELLAIAAGIEELVGFHRPDLPILTPDRL